MFSSDSVPESGDSSASLALLASGSGYGSGIYLAWAIWDLGNNFSKKSLLRDVLIGLLVLSFWDLFDIHYSALMIVFVIFLLYLCRRRAWKYAPFVGYDGKHP